MIHLNKFLQTKTWGFFKDFSDLVKRGIKDSNMNFIEVGLESIAELCATTWRGQMLNIAMADQIRVVMREFLKTWTFIIMKLVYPNIKTNTNDQKNIVLNLKLMKHCISLGHSLSTSQLPDEVEDALKDVMEPFYHILSFRKTHSQFMNNNSIKRLLNDCYTEILHILNILTYRYEETNALYAEPFLNAVWDLVPTLKEECYDSTVVGALKYFCGMTRYQTFWTFKKNTEGVLTELVEKILVKILIVGDEKIHQFKDEPGDFIDSDLYQEEVETRRNGCLKLICTLCESSQKDPILKAFLKFIVQLLGQYSKDRARNWKQQLLASDFMLGMSVLGQTRDLGVTRIQKNAPISQFFSDHIIPELEKEKANPIVLSRCLRILNMFRLQFPATKILKMAVALGQKYLTGSGEVISSYVATLIGNLANQKTKTGQTFISDDLIQKELGVFIKSLSQSLAKSSGTDTQWIPDRTKIEALLNLCLRFQNKLSEHYETLISLLQVLIKRSAVKEHDPHYTYCLYETFGTVINSICQHNRSKVTDVEKHFGPVLTSIITSRKIEDMIPFAYQILAILLHNYPQVPPQYQKLFDAAISTSGQDSSAAIPFLSIYMTKANILTQQSRFQNLLKSVQKLLNDPKTVRWGLDIADAVLRNETIVENVNVAVEIFKVILQVLQSKQQKRFVEKDFSRLLVALILKHKALKLKSILDRVGKGFYAQCIRIVIKFADDIGTFKGQRKYITAMVYLTDGDLIQESPKDWKDVVEKAITLMESKMKISKEEDRLDILEATGDSASSKIAYL
eukprot:UN25679